MFIRDKGESDPLVLDIHGEGKAADAGPGGLIEKRVLSGQRVLALDLRGLGETSPGVKAAGWTAQFGLDVRESFLSMHLDRPLLGQRVTDLLAVIEAVAAESKDVRLIGVGKAGPAALHVAVLDERISQLTLERSLVSWSSVVRTPVSRDQLANVVPGVLADYDLPDLTAAMQPRELRINDAVDAADTVLSQEAMDKAYARARATYAAASAGKKLTLKGS
jgi:pimeloyl-ACP methyl ester carboxylesterase